MSLLSDGHVSAGKILEASGGSFTHMTDAWVWLGLSTRELTRGLSRWLGLPHKMAASGESHSFHGPRLEGSSEQGLL